MPGASLLTVIDDIASVLDDVAVLTKIATKKTAGVLGDDLALNAQQVAGVKAERELPVVWAVAKGSLVNKAILVPAALAISAVAPWLVTPLLVVGGTFLCFEGFEKVVHKLFHKQVEKLDHERHVAALANEAVDLVAFERDKIKGAIRTDFVLSAEIVVIALGTVASEPLLTRLTVLVALSALMTVGVYGLVAGIVKLDDAGQYLVQRGKGSGSALQAGVGTAILAAAPWLMKGLGLAGTIAMFLVGGGILTHATPALHHLVEAAGRALGSLPVLGPAAAAGLPTLVDFIAGLAAGAVTLALWSIVQRLRGKPAHA
jgi:predicted DNA repair protein MutK